MHITKNSYLLLWLKVICLVLICMIFIGGVTRLTHSGLSITEWKPISGVIPPLSEESWNIEFNQYKKSPEYLQINHGMDLDDFKSIFWLEFIHRLAGRITGLLYLIPFLIFITNKTITRRDIVIYASGLLLLISQGFAGWYMVKSGLASHPHVSHFRLAIHLLLAIILYSLVFWQLLKNYYNTNVQKLKNCSLNAKILLNTSLILTFFQIALGALVAGLNAGLIYNTFPLMGDSMIPHEITTLTLKSLWDPVFIQFMHRIVAYILTANIMLICYIGFKLQNSLLSKPLVYLFIAITIQIILGIFTLIYSVPLIIALLHQLGAVIVLSIILWTKYLWQNL